MGDPINKQVLCDKQPEIIVVNEPSNATDSVQVLIRNLPTIPGPLRSASFMEIARQLVKDIAENGIEIQIDSGHTTTCQLGISYTVLRHDNNDITVWFIHNTAAPVAGVKQLVRGDDLTKNILSQQLLEIQDDFFGTDQQIISDLNKVVDAFSRSLRKSLAEYVSQNHPKAVQKAIHEAVYGCALTFASKAREFFEKSPCIKQDRDLSPSENTDSEHCVHLPKTNLTISA